MPRFLSFSRTLTAACASLLALAASTTAAPLNTRGIPANADGIVHLDLDAVRASEIGGLAIQGLDVRTKNGINLFPGVAVDSKDFNDVTCGMICLPPKNQDPAAQHVLFGDTSPVIIFRGKFSPAKIVAGAKAGDLKSETIGGHVFYDVTPKDKGALTTPLLFAVINNSTLLVVEKKFATAALAALSGSAKSYAPPAPLVSSAKALRVAPAALGYFNEKILAPEFLLAPAGTPTPTSAYFVIGDNREKFGIRVYASYKDAVAAKNTQELLNGFIGMARLQLGNSKKGTDAPEDPQVTQMKKLLNAFKLTASDTWLTISFTYPSKDALKLLQDATSLTSAAGPKKLPSH